MGRYLIKRFLYVIPSLLILSLISFLLIELPPGTFADTVAAEMMESGSVNEGAIKAIEERYGLNKPILEQYWKWITGILLRGDFGESFIWSRSVSSVLWERLGDTLILHFHNIRFFGSCHTWFPSLSNYDVHWFQVF